MEIKANSFKHQKTLRKTLCSLKTVFLKNSLKKNTFLAWKFNFLRTYSFPIGNLYFLRKMSFHLQNVHLPFCIFNSVETSFLIPRCFGDSITPLILIPVMDLVFFWNENKRTPEKINDTQYIFQAQTTNFGSYLMYVP